MTVRTTKTGETKTRILIDERGGDIELIIYKCPLEFSCFDCLSLKPAYQCGFCAKQTTKRKEMTHECALEKGSKCQINSERFHFFRVEDACPNPTFQSINPEMAPLQAGELFVK